MMRRLFENGIDVDLLLRSLDSMRDGILITDQHEKIVAVNEAACRNTGYSREELIGQTCRLLQGKGTQPELIAEMGRVVSTGGEFIGEVLNYRKDGTPFWNGISIAPVLDDGEPVLWVSMQRDITGFVAQRTAIETEHATTAMMLSVARALSGPTTGAEVAQIIADAVPGVWGADRSTVLFWDAATGRFVMAAISGWDGAIADALSVWESTPHDSPDLATLMESGLPSLLSRTSSDWARSIIDDFDITGFAMAPIEVSGRFLGVVGGHWSRTPPPLELDDTLIDRMTGLAGLAGVALDQTRLQNAIEWSTTHDPVTGLANRRLLEEQITAELRDLAENGGIDVTVLACDVDRFTRIAEAYPTAVVDSVLREIAARFLNTLAPGEFVARLGDDDFIVVTRAQPEDAEGTAMRLLDAFVAPFMIGDDTVHAGITIGGAVSADVARSGPSGDTAVTPAQRLISLALADLKSRSRNTGPGAMSVDPEESRLDTDLRSAVSKGEIAVHYQPQVKVVDGQLVGVEALVRWNHPTLGQISPVRFIPLAEFNGVIREIGRFVLETACSDAARWAAAGHPIEVSVNVAVHQLEDPGFADIVRRTTEAAGVPPERLTLEVTETRLVSDRSVAQGQLRRLCDLGYTISIDDFGTGFSSLTQVSNMPVGELKIDRSFVARVGDTGRPMVAGVIGLARGLEFRVVAEGVENEAQLVALRQLGCDRAQGYHLARPMPAEQLERDWLGELP